MAKRLLLMFLCSCLFLFAYGQQSIHLSSGLTEDNVLLSAPTRNLKVLQDGVEVTYVFSVANIQKDDLYEGTYLWKMDGFGSEDETSKPSVLQRTDQIQIPSGKTASVEVVSAEYKEYNYELAPARPPLTDSGNETYTKNNVKPIDVSLGIYPKDVVRKIDEQVYRGQKILNVEVFPIQYDVTRKVVRAYTKIAYKVKFVDASTRSSLDDVVATPASISADDSFLKNTTISSSPSARLEAYNTLGQNNTKGYLIVTIPKYAAAVNRLAEWKRTLGYDVTVQEKDSWSTEEVKGIISNLYNKGNLYYLLLFGDYEDVPSYTSKTMGISHVSDLRYGCMDGANDNTPDIHRGRISVTNISEANTVVDKIIQYEKNPVSDAAFYNTGVNCAYFQDLDMDGYADRRFAQTSEDVRNYLTNLGYNITRIYTAYTNVTPKKWSKYYSRGEDIPAELKKPLFAWNGSVTDVNNAINQGAFYVLHRDHGDVGGWGDPTYQSSDILKLTNGNKLPVVFSLNCLTGQYNGKTCFAETFLRKQNGGCVGILGATEVSYSGPNDVFAGGLFDAIWPNPGLRIVLPGQNSTGTTPTPTFAMGQVLDQGFARLAEIYGSNNSYTQYTKELFHYFGDPSMQIYTSKPTEFTNVQIVRGTNNVTVSLSNTSANISFYDKTTGKVLSYIGNTASFSTTTPQSITVCVSGHNKIPFVQEGIGTSTIYIQNETVSGSRTYDADLIKIGSSVTSSKQTGPVVFSNGTINLNAKEIIIEPNTTINESTTIKSTIK